MLISPFWLVRAEFRLLYLAAETRFVPWKLYSRDRPTEPNPTKQYRSESVFADAFYKYSNSFARMSNTTAPRVQNEDKRVEDKGFDALGNKGKRGNRLRQRLCDETMTILLSSKYKPRRRNPENASAVAYLTRHIPLATEDKGARGNAR